MLIEGAAALPIAAFKKQKQRFRDQTVVLVLSGAKISPDALKQIL